MKNEVSMRDSARHHFGKLLRQFWLHVDANLAPKIVPKRVLSASRALPETIRNAFWPSLGVPWGAPGCSSAVLGRSGPSWGYPRACLGPILEGFGMDLEVRAAKEEGIHNEPSLKK